MGGSTTDPGGAVSNPPRAVTGNITMGETCALGKPSLTLTYSFFRGNNVKQVRQEHMEHIAQITMN